MTLQTLTTETLTTAGLVASEAPNGVHFAGDKNEIYWGSAAFFVLMALIIWKGGPAIKKMFNSRPERIRDELAAAKAEREEAERALNASTADLPDIDVEEDRIRAESLETAARLKEETAKRSKSDAAALRSRGTAEVENMKRQALADLREEMAELTRKTTDTIVLESLDPKSHDDLIDSYIKQVSQLS